MDGAAGRIEQRQSAPARVVGTEGINQTTVGPSGDGVAATTRQVRDLPHDSRRRQIDLLERRGLFAFSVRQEIEGRAVAPADRLELEGRILAGLQLVFDCRDRTTLDDVPDSQRLFPKTPKETVADQTEAAPVVLDLADMNGVFRTAREAAHEKALPGGELVKSEHGENPGDLRRFSKDEALWSYELD